MGTGIEGLKQVVLKVKLIIKRKSKELLESDIFTKQADNAFLTNIANMNSICRIYYGDDEENKPNDFCTWWEGLSFDGPDGWYENDNHLRKRIIKARGL